MASLLFDAFLAKMCLETLSNNKFDSWTDLVLPHKNAVQTDNNRNSIPNYQTALFWQIQVPESRIYNVKTGEKHNSASEVRDCMSFNQRHQNPVYTLFFRNKL